MCFHNLENISIKYYLNKSTMYKNCLLYMEQWGNSNYIAHKLPSLPEMSEDIHISYYQLYHSHHNHHDFVYSTNLIGLLSPAFCPAFAVLRSLTTAVWVGKRKNMESRDLPLCYLVAERLWVSHLTSLCLRLQML